MLGKTNAKMFCQEMEIKIGLVPGSLPQCMLTGKHLAGSISPLLGDTLNIQMLS